ncbi:MAG: hypothetical protein VW711_15760 [Verrucomicrobiales bacterium]
MKPFVLIIGWLTCFHSLTAESRWVLERVQTPASERALAPNLCSLKEQFAFTWIEPELSGKATVHLSRWNGSAFDATLTIAESHQMFANWADIPSMVETRGGDWYAQWLEKLGADTYAYGIRIQRSTDQGKTWQPMGWLHGDQSKVEHGFVSFALEGDDARAFWLDGREMTQPKGKMTLRTALLAGSEIRNEKLLDENVCTCCPTTATTTPDGPLVFYRDRTAKEIRDIRWVRRHNDQWSPPSPLADDQWIVPGCPVNGPSVASCESHLAVSRFTAADDKPKVILAVHSHKDPSHKREIVLDDQAPLGGCSTVTTGQGFATTWLGREGDGIVLRLAEVSLNGTLTHEQILTQLKGPIFRGRTCVLSKDDHLWVTWTDQTGVNLACVKRPLK